MGSCICCSFILGILASMVGSVGDLEYFAPCQYTACRCCITAVILHYDCCTRVRQCTTAFIAYLQLQPLLLLQLLGYYCTCQQYCYFIIYQLAYVYLVLQWYYYDDALVLVLLYPGLMSLLMLLCLLFQGRIAISRHFVDYAFQCAGLGCLMGIPSDLVPARLYWGQSDVHNCVHPCGNCTTSMGNNRPTPQNHCLQHVASAAGQGGGCA